MINKNIPNIITIFRVAIIPVIIVTFYLEHKIFAHRLSASLFVLAGISDFFDGYLARKYNIQSSFGRMLDPIADKILVGCVLMMLIHFDKANIIPCLLILTREFVVSGLREFLAEIHVSMPVSQLAKIKTAVQMLALFILLLGTQGSGIKYLDQIGQILLWIAAILTLVTAYSYIEECKKHFSF